MQSSTSLVVAYQTDDVRTGRLYWRPDGIFPTFGHDAMRRAKTWADSHTAHQAIILEMPQPVADAVYRAGRIEDAVVLAYRTQEPTRKAIFTSYVEAAE